MPINKSIPSLEKEMDVTQQKIDETKGSLTSAGAYGGVDIPTFKTTSRESTLKGLQSKYQSLYDQRQKAKWYPETKVPATTKSEATTDPGWIGKGLDALSFGNRLMVGGVAHAFGQGDSGSLVGDMWDNATTHKKYMGDVLKTAGVPGPIAAVGGFAGDVLLDPVNWATAGSASLVGAVGKGAMKAGMKGATAGAVSNLARKAATVGRILPGVKSTETFATLAERSKTLGAEYKTLVGEGAYDFLKPTALERGWDSVKEGLGEVVDATVKEFPKTKSFFDALPYHPERWVNNQKVLQDLKAEYGEDLAGLAGGGENLASKGYKSYFDGTIKTLGEVNSKDLEAHIKYYNEQIKLPSMSRDKAIEELATDLDEAMHIVKNPEAFIAVDGQEVSRRLLAEAVKESNRKLGVKVLEKDIPGQIKEIENLAKDVTKVPFTGTGASSYDNAMAKFYKYRAGNLGGGRAAVSGKVIMDGYKNIMDVFRFSKVAASTTALANAVMGNAVFSHMIGEHVWDPQYWKRLKQVYDLYSGAPGSNKIMNEIIMSAPNSELLRESLEKNLSAFRLMTGGYPSFLKAGTQDVAMTSRALIEKTAKQKGWALNEEDLAKVEEIMADAKKFGLSDEEFQALGLGGLSKRGERGGLDLYKQRVTEGGYSSAGKKGTGLLTTELEGSALANVMRKIAEKSVSTSGATRAGYKALNVVANKLPNAFEKTDQVFKLTSFIRSTVDGYSAEQLQKMRGFIKIDPTDLHAIQDEATGGLRYTLTPDKAMELAQVTFMNYAAMPSAVKIMRNLPLVGSPFASFIYANAIKTGSTVIHNPMAFNKLTYALNEFGGSKTPLERQAIYNPQSSGYKYYGYLGQPGMYRVPFIDDNPVYVNFASAIPAMSMNMFAPDQMKYEVKGLDTETMNAINRSGLFSDPVGQLFKNYVLQPVILRDSILLRGGFGQPLYPVDATALEKAGYATRDVAEGLVPGSAALPLAVGASLTGIPREAVPLYGARKLMGAFKGQTPLGISGKEPATSRTARAVLGQVGVPVQAPVKTEYNK